MDTVQIKCPKCGTDNRLHTPVIVRSDNGVLSQVTLVPAWSPQERVCPGCKSIIAPMLLPEVRYQWVAMEPAAMPVEEEPSRIVRLGMQLPREIPRKINQG